LRQRRDRGPRRVGWAWLGQVSHILDEAREAGQVFNDRLGLAQADIQHHEVVAAKAPARDQHDVGRQPSVRQLLLAGQRQGCRQLLDHGRDTASGQRPQRAEHVRQPSATLYDRGYEADAVGAPEVHHIHNAGPQRRS